MELEDLGKLIKQRRTTLGLTILDLAEFTTMSKTTISKIERGVTNPTFEILHDIFEYLNLEMKVEIKNVDSKL
jgi:transcriptional regulator with XRE-family HTH domain